MTKFAPSAAPINALKTWVHGQDIYVEIPGSPGCPCAVFRFPLSENGLWRALHLLQSHPYEYGGEPYPSGTRPVPPPINPLTELAGSILTQMGVRRK
jgi:hypothetical protein